MPYKNPEDKRQWEREHREEQNARRRMQGAPAAQVVRKRQHPTPFQIKNRADGNRFWGGAIGIGVVLLLSIGGINPPASPLARR
jgi:hypothetical protein